MKHAWRLSRIVPAVLVALTSCAIAQAATVALLAVEVNGQPMDPGNTVSACPGDTLVAEIYLAEWSPQNQGLKIYQATVDSSGYLSGSAGYVLPFGWDAPFDPPPCGAPDYQECPVGLHCYARGCVGPDHDPDSGAFIDTSRSDFVFYGLTPLAVVDPSKLDYRYGGTFLAGVFPIYSPPAAYGGTLILTVSDDAAGTFVIPFLEGLETFLKDQDTASILPLDLQPLTVVISGEGAPCNIESSNPPSCAIDPRQPFAPGGRNPQRQERVTLNFGGDASNLTVDDFEIDDRTPFPPAPYKLTVESGSNTAVLVFDRQITTGRWTCVTYLPRQEVICFGSQPGDVDGDGTSDHSDLLLLIDQLNGAINPPLALEQCDLDRSGRCTPADLLRGIDLLSGGDAYEPWLNRTILLECTSTP